MILHIPVWNALDAEAPPPPDHTKPTTKTNVSLETTSNNDLNETKGTKRGYTKSYHFHRISGIYTTLVATWTESRDVTKSTRLW